MNQIKEDKVPIFLGHNGDNKSKDVKDVDLIKIKRFVNLLSKKRHKRKKRCLAPVGKGVFRRIIK